MAINKPFCIDIYSGDNVSDIPALLAGFNQVKAAGIAFLIHKASEGVGYHDPRYAARRSAWMNGTAIPVTDVDGTALELYPAWGAYHFFHGTSEAAAIAEAKYFLGVAALGPGDFACLDWENVGASGYAPPAVYADAFCKTVEDALGRACAVYGGNVPRENLTSSVGSAVITNFSARQFWFCQYGAYQPSLLPLAWKETGPFLWQDDGDRYGPGPHVIPGIVNPNGSPEPCDNSTVVGAMTVAKLAAAWGK